ncbi:hypothetical protein ACFLTW_03375 [Chloroflexota bacterium]
MNKRQLVRITITLGLLLTMILVPTAPVSAADVNLRAPAIGVGSDTETVGATWSPIATADVHLSGLSSGDRVLVISSVSTSEPDKAMIGSFRIRNHDTSLTSTTFMRELTDPRDVDYGLVSVIDIFTADGDDNDAYTIEHSTNNPDIISDATIVAIPLETLDGETERTLPSGEKEYASIDTVPNDTTWEEVGGDTNCRTPNVVVEIDSHIYVAASIESQSTGGGTPTGYWRLEYSTDGFETPIVVGNAISRSMDGNNDLGNITLIGLIESATPNTYEFRVAHSGTTDAVQTNKVNLVAVALNDGIHHLQAWKAEASPDTTINTSLENVAGATLAFTPDVSSSDLLVHSQFNMSGTTASGSTSQHAITVSQGPYTTQEMFRFISDGSDTGSGSSVGLTSITNSSCTVNLQHAIDTGTLTTSTPLLLAFAAGYDTETPPIPEIPTYLMVGGGMVLVVAYYLFRRRPALARNP